jgi:hypothetical protein
MLPEDNLFSRNKPACLINRGAARVLLRNFPRYNLGSVNC